MNGGVSRINAGLRIKAAHKAFGTGGDPASVKATARSAKARSFFQRTNSETKMQTTNKQVIAYLRRIGSNGGKSKSPAKKAACRANGKKEKTRRPS